MLIRQQLCSLPAAWLRYLGAQYLTVHPAAHSGNLPTFIIACHDYQTAVPCMATQHTCIDVPALRRRFSVRGGMSEAALGSATGVSMFDVPLLIQSPGAECHWTAMVASRAFVIVSTFIPLLRVKRCRRPPLCRHIRLLCTQTCL